MTRVDESLRGFVGGFAHGRSDKTILRIWTLFFRSGQSFKETRLAVLPCHTRTSLILAFPHPFYDTTNNPSRPSPLSASRCLWQQMANAETIQGATIPAPAPAWFTKIPLYKRVSISDGCKVNDITTTHMSYGFVDTAPRALLLLPHCLQIRHSFAVHQRQHDGQLPQQVAVQQHGGGGSKQLCRWRRQRRGSCRHLTAAGKRHCSSCNNIIVFLLEGCHVVAS